MHRFATLLVTASLCLSTTGSTFAQTKPAPAAPETDTKKEAEPDKLPDGMKGFRGMFTGTLVSKDLGQRAFVVKVTKITKTWKMNEAAEPKEAVGKKLYANIHPTRLEEQHYALLRELEPGDKLVVEAFDFNGKNLSVVEELKRDEGE